MEHLAQKIWHNLYFRLSLALLWLALVWYLMIMPLPDSGLPSPYTFIIDKIVHLVLFGALTALLWRALKTWFHNHLLRMILLVAVTFSYAYLIEYWQGFTSSRMPSFWDLFWGTVGIGLAILIIWEYREKKPSLLVHLCCGPCGSGAIKALKKKYRLILLFANSNIDTADEFHKRWQAARELANFHGLKLIKSPYTHEYWTKLIAGHEDAPEKGSRCQICYRLRMYEAAVTAQILGYKYFTTSLSTSPYKDKTGVMSIGKDLEKLLKVNFLDFDFSADDGYKASVNESKRLRLYRQKYCGCEYSKSHLKR